MGGKGKTKRRKSSDASVDIVSNLPRDVIFVIMGHLPLRDAARISVLSHKWHDIWLSTPQLVFDGSFFSHVIRRRQDVSQQICNIVSKLILQHHGPIVKFSLFVPRMKGRLDVDQWLSFLSRNGIKDFSLENDRNSYLVLSSHLFSCVGLEKLKLQRCVLANISCSCLRNLARLEFVDVDFRVGVLQHLIANCPQLEELNIIDCLGSIPTIDAPNLRHLVITRHFVDIKHCENLLTAIFDQRVFLKRGFRYETILQNLIDAFANSAKLEKLCLRSHFYRVLFQEFHVPSTFGILRILELSCIPLRDVECFYSAVRAIQTCPNIERLSISVDSSIDCELQMLDYNPDRTLQKLRWAKVVICGAFNMEMKLIELLLACSPILETLSVSFTETVKNSLELRMLGQLIGFHRASPQVSVTVSDPPKPSNDPFFFLKYSKFSWLLDETSESDSDIDDSSSSGSE